MRMLKKMVVDVGERKGEEGQKRGTGWCWDSALFTPVQGHLVAVAT